MKDPTELHRPVEWLRSLQETPDAYARLVRDSGSVTAAAHRLASARCRTQVPSSHIPTLRELAAAVTELSRHALTDTKQLTRARLIDQCEALGLRVILPITSLA